MAFSSYSGSSDTAAVTSADLPDPYVPVDGTMNVTGGLNVSGASTFTGDVTFNGAVGSISLGASETIVPADGTLNVTGALSLTGGLEIGAGEYLGADGIYAMSFPEQMDIAVDRFQFSKKVVVGTGVGAVELGGLNGRTLNIGSGLNYDFRSNGTTIADWDIGGVYNFSYGVGTVNALIFSSGAFDGTTIKGTGLTTAFAAKVANYTVTDADYTLTGDPTTASFTFTLPTAVGRAGKRFMFKKLTASANTITIDGNAAETIDGAATLVIATQDTTREIQSDGANWIVYGGLGAL